MDWGSLEAGCDIFCVDDFGGVDCVCADSSVADNSVVLESNFCSQKYFYCLLI